MHGRTCQRHLRTMMKNTRCAHLIHSISSAHNSAMRCAWRACACSVARLARSRPSSSESCVVIAHRCMPSIVQNAPKEVQTRSYLRQRKRNANACDNSAQPQYTNAQ